MMSPLTVEKARELLIQTEELVAAIRVRKTRVVENGLAFAKENGVLQEMCTAGLSTKEKWLDAVRNEPDYALLHDLGRHKNIPIIEAIRLSRTSYVMMMLESGLDINKLTRRSQKTPLGTAVRFANDDLLHTLIETYHADPNMKDLLSQTPIYSAIDVRKPEVLKYLLEKGADVNNIDSFGQTPLLVLLSDKQLRLQDKEILEILLENNADCNIQQPSSDLSPIQLIISNTSAPVNIKVDFIEVLLKYQADPDRINKKKCAALHTICSETCSMMQKNQCDVITLLVKYGANPNVQDDNYNTPLHYAVQANLPKVIEILTENGANPKLRNENGLRPYDIESSKGSKMVLEEAMQKWTDNEVEKKESKANDTNNMTGNRKGPTFGKVSQFLQSESDSFGSHIDRLADAITQLEQVRPTTKYFNTCMDDADEIDASPVRFVENSRPTCENTVLSRNEDIELIKGEFNKLKAIAYSLQEDVKKVVTDLKTHENCQATFAYTNNANDGRVPQSYYDQPTQLPLNSVDDRMLIKACHITSTILGHNWKSLFRQLDSEAFIENEVIIKELETKYPGQLREQAYQSLITWKLKSGKRATYSELLAAVRACSLGAIEQNLETEFPFTT